jgi:hypothetical protein
MCRTPYLIAFTHLKLARAALFCTIPVRSTIARCTNPHLCCPCIKIFASLYHIWDMEFEHARCWEDEQKKWKHGRKIRTRGVEPRAAANNVLYQPRCGRSCTIHYVRLLIVFKTLLGPLLHPRVNMEDARNARNHSASYAIMGPREVLSRSRS